MTYQQRTIVQILRISAIAFGCALLLFLILDIIVMPLYTQQGKVTHVPHVVGMTVELAKQALADSGLKAVEAETRPDKQYPIGTIALQNPSAGSEVKFGRGVYLTVSGGEKLVAVPALRGKSIREATFTLERFGLALGMVSYQPSAELPENTIIEQEVASGTSVKRGSRINLIVSQGRTADRLPVPKVVMKTLAEAEKIIVRSGFKVGNITYQINLDLLPNTVIDQFPRSGELGDSGKAIDLFVAKKGDQPPNLEN